MKTIFIGAKSSNQQRFQRTDFAGLDRSIGLGMVKLCQVGMDRADRRIGGDGGGRQFLFGPIPEIGSILDRHRLDLFTFAMAAIAADWRGDGRCIVAGHACRRFGMGKLIPVVSSLA